MGIALGEIPIRQHGGGYSEQWKTELNARIADQQVLPGIN